MSFNKFVTAVDNLVGTWKDEPATVGAAPREKLRAIYDDVSEQAVHRLAEALRQRDDALRKLHKHYLVAPTK